MKIINIKKRNWLMRFISIENYVVTVEVDGKIKKYNCYAGEPENINKLTSYLIQKILFGKPVKKNDW